jgi:hypothetical protein
MPRAGVQQVLLFMRIQTTALLHSAAHPAEVQAGNLALVALTGIARLPSQGHG